MKKKIVVLLVCILLLTIVQVSGNRNNSETTIPIESINEGRVLTSIVQKFLINTKITFFVDSLEIVNINTDTDRDCPCSNNCNAIDDYYTVAEDSINNKFNVLYNDVNCNVILALHEGPRHGTAYTDHSYVYYTPNPDYYGNDTFLYEAQESPLEGAHAWIIVTPVDDPPEPHFTYTPRTPTTQDIIQFSDASIEGDGTIISWSWTFGDGYTSSDQNPTHQYSEDDGSYTVRLTVTDENSLSGTTNQDISVANEPPTAYIDTIEPNPASKLDTISFVGYGEDADGAIVASQWESNLDGVLSTDASFISEDLSLGTHSISFKVLDDNDEWSDEVTETLVIQENQHPSIVEIAGPIRGNTGKEYSYTFVATDSEGHDISYYIDWGDSTTTEWTILSSSGEDVEVTHTWDAEGDYTIKAKARDIYDAEGDWGELTVSMPKVKSQINPILMQFLERFLDRFLILMDLRNF